MREFAGGLLQPESLDARKLFADPGWVGYVPATSGYSKVFLPFEGDERLAVILSKAFLLAEDKKISDPTILSQIGR